MGGKQKRKGIALPTKLKFSEVVYLGQATVSAAPQQNAIQIFRPGTEKPLVVVAASAADRDDWLALLNKRVKAEEVEVGVRKRSRSTTALLKRRKRPSLLKA